MHTHTHTHKHTDIHACRMRMALYLLTRRCRGSVAFDCTVFSCSAFNCNACDIIVSALLFNTHDPLPSRPLLHQLNQALPTATHQGVEGEVGGAEEEEKKDRMGVEEEEEKKEDGRGVEEEEGEEQMIKDTMGVDAGAPVAFASVACDSVTHCDNATLGDSATHCDGVPHCSLVLPASGADGGADGREGGIRKGGEQVVVRKEGGEEVVSFKCVGASELMRLSFLHTVSVSEVSILSLCI